MSETPFLDSGLFGTITNPRRFTDAEARALQHRLRFRLKFADDTKLGDRERMLIVLGPRMPEAPRS